MSTANGPQQAVWDDRNALARQCADLRDELDTARALIVELRAEVSEKSVDLDLIRCRYEEDTGHEWDGRAFPSATGRPQ